jgi:hypothetical protein
MHILALLSKLTTEELHQHKLENNRRYCAKIKAQKGLTNG